MPTTNLFLTGSAPRGRRTGWRSGLARALARVAVVVAVVLAGLLACAAGAQAVPTPSPSPSSPAVDATCAAKAPGSVAWCMPWAVHVDKPVRVRGVRSHWVTACSKATDDADRRSCAAASVALGAVPPDGTASVLMDGPSTGKGPAGLIDCTLLTDPSTSSPGPGSPWEHKQGACAGQVAAWSKQMFDPDPKPVDCSLADLNCKIQQQAQQALAGTIGAGFQGLVDVAVQGTVWLLSKLATQVFTVTAISSPDAAFYTTYNSLAGVLVGLIFVFFILSTIINGLRTNTGPSPVATLGGLVRAVLGVTFAAGIAYTIVVAWDQATNAVIAANARTPYDPSWLVTSFSQLTGGAGTLFIAFLMAVLATFGLLLLFVIMLFRGLLATGAALFGAMAMTGQVKEETRHWGRRWFWTINALGSSKLFIAELWIYGSRSAYGSDNILNALRGLLLIWLMVAAPWILMRLTTLWDGYLSDVNAHALLSASQIPVDVNATPPGAGTGGGGGGGGSPASAAAGVMGENTADMPTTPLDGAGDAAGLGNGTGRQAADAASTGGDGGRVGQPAEDTEAGQGETGSGDKPNAQEADGLEAGIRSAEHDVSAGQLTAPGDATGAGGSVPATPAAPRGSEPTSAPMLQPAGAEAADGGASTGTGVPGSSGPEPASGSSPGAPPTSESATPATPEDTGTGPETPTKSSAQGAGGAGSSSAETAASLATEVPLA
ncbi:hypothetical protein [Actinoplanes sp. NPDC051411]|uniref:hypothetical protein n=1 Tax=Actinoplanes sp. NPDC051411 TaxID=3155522 RepID=UPI0034472C98